MRLQFLRMVLVFLSYNSLLLCESLAAIRQNDRARGSFLFPRQTVAISTLPTVTIYTTINALDPFQSRITSTKTTFFSSTITRSPSSATVVTVTVTDTYVGPFMQNSGCSLASQELVYCTSLTPGFMTTPWASQTDCLCSSQDGFNSAVNSCAQYASTADTNLYSEITSWQDFCTTAASSSPSLSRATTTSGHSFSTNTGIHSGTATQSSSSSPSSTPNIGSSGSPVTDLTPPQRIGIISGCAIFRLGLSGVAAYAACFKRKSSPTSGQTEKDKISDSDVIASAASPMLQKHDVSSPGYTDEHHPLHSRVTF